MKKRKDELEFVKKVSQHPRGQLKRELKKWSDELEFVKLIPQNPRDRLKRKQKNKEGQFTNLRMMHPREWKKLKKIGNFLLSSTLDFNLEDILNKSIQLELKKTSEDKILDRIIKK